MTIKTKLKKWGNSIGVRIPKTFLVHMGIDNEQEIEMRIEGDTIILKKPEETLEQRLERITPENRHEYIDWGPPVGKEVW